MTSSKTTGHLTSDHIAYLQSHGIGLDVAEERGYTSVYSAWGHGPNAIETWGCGHKHWARKSMDFYNQKGALAAPLWMHGAAQYSSAHLRLDRLVRRPKGLIRWFLPHRRSSFHLPVPFDLHPSQNLDGYPAQPVLLTLGVVTADRHLTEIRMAGLNVTPLALVVPGKCLNDTGLDTQLLEMVRGRQVYVTREIEGGPYGPSDQHKVAMLTGLLAARTDVGAVTDVTMRLRAGYTLTAIVNDI